MPHPQQVMRQARRYWRPPSDVQVVAGSYLGVTWHNDMNRGAKVGDREIVMFYAAIYT